MDIEDLSFATSFMPQFYYSVNVNPCFETTYLQVHNSPSYLNRGF